MRVLSILVVLFCFVKTSECFPRVTEFEIGRPDETEYNTKLVTDDENALDESLNDDVEDSEDVLDQSNVAKPKGSDDFVFEEDKTDAFTVDSEEGDDLDDFTADPDERYDQDDFTVDPEEEDDLDGFSVDHEEEEDLDDFNVYPEVGDDLDDFTVDHEIGQNDFEDRSDSSNANEVLQQDGERDLRDAVVNGQHDNAMNFVLPEHQGSARAGLMTKLFNVPEQSSDVVDEPISGQDILVASDNTHEQRQGPSFVDMDETRQPFRNIQDSFDVSTGSEQPFDNTARSQSDEITSEEYDIQSSEAALPVVDSRQFSYESEETPQDEHDMQASQDSEVLPVPIEPSNDIDESEDFDDSEESFHY